LSGTKKDKIEKKESKQIEKTTEKTNLLDEKKEEETGGCGCCG